MEITETGIFMDMGEGSCFDIWLRGSYQVKSAVLISAGSVYRKSGRYFCHMQVPAGDTGDRWIGRSGNFRMGIPDRFCDTAAQEAWR